MQAPKSTVETTIGSKPSMQESFGALKTRIDFVDNGTTTEKQNMV
jgi:hypothetical protein